MPPLEQLASQEGLPCNANPSDHLPLLARLSFAPEEEEGVAVRAGRGKKAAWSKARRAK